MSKASDGPISRVEVITSVQRRRRWSTAENVRLVEEAMQPGMSASFVARQASVSPSQLFASKRQMLEGSVVSEHLVEDRVVACARVLGDFLMNHNTLCEEMSGAEFSEPDDGRRESTPYPDWIAAAR